MITEDQLATTSLAVTYEFEPSKHIIGDLSGLIAEFSENLVGAFYPRTVGRKVNVVVTELFTNAVMHNSDGSRRIRVSLRLDGDTLSVAVCNAATAQQGESVRALVERACSADDARTLLARTIRERRAAGELGGLGLIRLVAENKFGLAASQENDEICVEARFSIGGTA